MRQLNVRRRAAVLAAVCLLAAIAWAPLPARAQPRGPAAADPDWPCVQRLVPNLAAASYWPDAPTPAGEWRADPSVVALVRAAAPRRVDQSAAERAVAEWAAGVPAGPDRAGRLGIAYAGLLEEVGRERTEAIAGLRRLARRQRDVGALVQRVTAELRALPADAPAETREEVTTRRTFVLREFDEVERTLRYACEIPVQEEARIGALARVLRRAAGD